MKAIFIILCVPILLISLGCNPSKNTPYVPSISSLAPNETLVMKYRACHNGCTKGTVKFRNGEASIGRHSLGLTTIEIAELDSYFLAGVNDGWLCSLIIKISFKHKQGMRTLNTKGVQIYPCRLLDGDIWPEELVSHLNQSPDEIPYWRLSKDEQYKILTGSFE